MIPKELVTVADGRITFDEDGIDIFDFPRQEIKPYISTRNIKPYDQLSIVYLDIETYSPYSHQLNIFTDNIVRGFMRVGDSQVLSKITEQLNDAGVLIAEHIKVLAACYKSVKFLVTPEVVSAVEYLYSNNQYLKDIYDKPALYPELGKIALIGIRNERGTNIIIDCIEDEEAGLRQFFKILEKKKPDILAHFNGFWFDLPYIISRAEHYGLKHPFWVNNAGQTCYTIAVRFAQPAIYNSIYLRYGDRRCAVIDLYHQSLAWDFTYHKLTKYTLKQVPLQLGLRKEARLELSPDEMFKCIRDGNIEPLKEYLIYDLEDTHLLGDFLIPPLYYQSEFLDWQLQSITTGGMGSKWDSLLIGSYKKLGQTQPEPDRKWLYEGGLVGSVAGLYKDVSKVDVTSLYPHVMLIYQVHSHKDTELIQLGILEYMLANRLSLKKLAKTAEDPKERMAANHRQGSVKIFINSGYGVLATMGKCYNDYIAAANVTAYGRVILRYILKLIKDCGGTPVSWDTDGVYYTSPDGFAGNKSIHEHVNSLLPNNGKYAINLEYELEATAFYTPPLKKGDEYVLVDNDDEDREPYYQGLRKSYIIVTKDGAIKSKGKFVKRNAYGLEKEFIPNMCKHHCLGTSQEYLKDILSQLNNRTYPVEKLAITRKIAANEKRLVELGIGKIGDVVTIWKGHDIAKIGKRGLPLKSVVTVWTKAPDDLDWGYYIQQVQGWISEFNDMLK